MKKINFFGKLMTVMMVAMLSVGITSCSSGDDDPDEVAVSMQSVNLSESGGSQSIQVLSNTNWTVSGAQGWLTVSPTQGSGNGMITVNANANTDNNSRTCMLTINAGDAMTTISVYQPGKVKADPATEVSASYTGTLKPMGYSDDPARCYVTITRLSNDAVRLSSLICEEFGLNMNAVNLIVNEQSDGRIVLQSETSMSVEGTYYQGQLTLSFSTSIATFYFSGVKN